MARWMHAVGARLSVGELRERVGGCSIGLRTLEMWLQCTLRQVEQAILPRPELVVLRREADA